MKNHIVLIVEPDWSGMSDLIKREDVIEALKQRLEDDYLDGYELLKYIKALPTVEPERKKGEWIYEGKRGRFPACKCSICGHYENADWAILQGANFCSHCGAEMKSE